MDGVKLEDVNAEINQRVIAGWRRCGQYRKVLEERNTPNSLKRNTPNSLKRSTPNSLKRTINCTIFDKCGRGIGTYEKSDKKIGRRTKKHGEKCTEQQPLREDNSSAKEQRQKTSFRWQETGWILSKNAKQQMGEITTEWNCKRRRGNPKRRRRDNLIVDSLSCEF